MESPIEQVQRHVSVLKDVFATRQAVLPHRFGVQLKPTLKSLVVVSKRGRISRPAAGSQVDGLDTVVKSDQIVSKMIKTSDQAGTRETFVALTKVVSSETLENLARQIVALHKPLRIDWAARFGLSPEPPATLLVDRLEVHPQQLELTKSSNVVPIGSTVRAVCAACGRAASGAVVGYCRANALLFGGRIYCVSCQRRVTSRPAIDVSADNVT
jgi:hypothetical protein